MRKTNKLWAVLSALTIFAFVFPAYAFTAAAGNPQTASIHLKTGSFNPGKGEKPVVPPGLAVSDAATLRKGYGYYLVQFSGPVQDSWKTSLETMGATLLEYIPDFAIKVRMAPGLVQRIQRLPQVVYVGAFEPAFKQSPDLVRTQASLFTVRAERGIDGVALAAEVAATGAEVVSIEANNLTVAAAPQQLNALANVIDVAWIENFRFYEKHNESGAGGIMGAASAYALGYDGSTQIVAVADTGLGGGTATTAHADIPSGRIVAIYNWRGADDSCWTITDDGAIDVDSGHGTHVAVSVLGDGSPTGVAKGTAPGARLVFQATENWATMKGLCAIYYTSGYYLTGLPTDLRTLFQQAYDAGARIHSNSWGSAAAGDYTANSVYADDFAWNHKDMLITFSAGNEGIDANSDGVIDNDSIGAPATAKNVLTVGASENQRSDNFPCDTSLGYTTCASQGGLNSIFTWGGAWPADYPANPINSDPSAGNAQQMAAFSSRGPTDDGRIKPDVVAPGSWVLSGYSDLYQQSYDGAANPKNGAYQYDGYGFPYSQAYKYLSGTSMSNPLTAGGAAVVRDYYNKAKGVQASAALVKATLINSATDMLDENNDGANDNDFPIPNNHEGWGLVNLANATDGTAQFIETAPGLSTGGSASYSFAVSTAGSPFKVSLAWTDFPSTDAAAINLVNDLDLTVTAPNGTIYRGNVFSGGWSTTGGSADRRNNVENVYIASASTGTWTVTVSGFNIPQGPQPFAIVADGVLDPAGPTPTPTPPPPASTGFLSPTANSPVSSGSGDNNGFETSPANAYANDTLVASDINSGSGTSTLCSNNKKDRHQFYGFGFNLPGTATVTGIQVKLKGRADSASSSPKFCVEISRDGGTTWTAAQSTGALGASEAEFTLGGASDLWGTAWTASQVNSGFRVRITSVSSSTARDFYLNYVSVNVSYQP